MFINSTYQNLDFQYKDQPKRVLALIAPRKSGKSFCSQVAVDLDSRFKLKSFADPIKKMFAEYKGIPVGDLYHQRHKEDYRVDIVEFSRKIKQDRGMYFWAETYFNSLSEEGLYVCDDLRLLEELQLLCMFGGVVYRVWAEPHQRRAWGWVYDPAVDEDISERDLRGLSAEALHHCTGGGYIYNTSSGKDHLINQLIPILTKHFPEPIASSKSSDSLKKMMALEM